MLSKSAGPNAALYCDLLEEDVVFLPKETAEYFNTFHTFVIQVDQRDKLIAHLNERVFKQQFTIPFPFICSQPQPF